MMARKPKRPQPRHYQTIEREIGGKTYAGRFYVESGWVHVECFGLGSEKAVVHGIDRDANGLAGVLMLEIVGKATREGRLKDAGGP